MALLIPFAMCMYSCIRDSSNFGKSVCTNRGICKYEFINCRKSCTNRCVSAEKKRSKNERNHFRFRDSLSVSVEKLLFPMPFRRPDGMLSFTLPRHALSSFPIVVVLALQKTARLIRHAQQRKMITFATNNSKLTCSSLPGN